MMWRGVMLSVLILAAPGCPLGEAEWRVTGTARVSPELQRRFSAAQPGRLLYSNDALHTQNANHLLAVLCAPLPETLQAPLIDTGTGCGHEHTVGVRLEPFDGRGLQVTPCGVKQVFWPPLGQPDHPETAVAQATQVVFQSPGQCEEMAEVTLVLAPIEGR
jgi:hypothetical protein